jgi:hypothetical protein
LLRSSKDTFCSKPFTEICAASSSPDSWNTLHTNSGTSLAHRTLLSHKITNLS